VSYVTTLLNKEIKGKTMTTIFLGSGDSFPVAATADVYGADGIETVSLPLNQAQDIQLDTYIDRIEFASALSEYQFQLIGNIVSVNTGGHTLANIILGDTPATLVFADGSADVIITGLGQATLGNVTLPDQALSLTGVNLDTNDNVLPEFILI